jgi:hypothetical protein
MKKKPKKFNKVEMELIKADIAFLKEQEKVSGDWDKWLVTQRKFGDQMYKSNRELYDNNGPKMKAHMEFVYGPDPRIKPGEEPKVKPKSTRRKSKKQQSE